MNSKNPLFNTVNTTIEVSVRLLVFFLLVAWCLMIVLPFLTPIIWGILLAVALSPVYNALNSQIKRPKLTSFLISLVILAIMLVPAILFLSSIIRGFHDLGVSLREGSLEVPAPDPEVAKWPVIGDENQRYLDAGTSQLGRGGEKIQ